MLVDVHHRAASAAACEQARGIASRMEQDEKRCSSTMVRLGHDSLDTVTGVLKTNADRVEEMQAGLQSVDTCAQVGRKGYACAGWSRKRSSTAGNVCRGGIAAVAGSWQTGKAGTSINARRWQRRGQEWNAWGCGRAQVTMAPCRHAIL